MKATKLQAASERFARMAEEQARVAATTTLPRVRERCLESERAFLVIAARAAAVEQDKRERLAAVVPRPAAARPRRFGYG